MLVIPHSREKTWNQVHKKKTKNNKKTKKKKTKKKQNKTKENKQKHTLNLACLIHPVRKRHSRIKHFSPEWLFREITSPLQTSFFLKYVSWSLRYGLVE